MGSGRVVTQMLASQQSRFNQYLRLGQAGSIAVPTLFPSCCSSEPSPKPCSTMPQLPTCPIMHALKPDA